MSEWLLPVGVSLAALAGMYLFCIRPMRQGHCHGTTSTRRAVPDSTDGATRDLERALEVARRDLAELRQEHAPREVPQPRLVRAPSDNG